MLLACEAKNCLRVNRSFLPTTWYSLLICYSVTQLVRRRLPTTWYLLLNLLLFLLLLSYSTCYLFLPTAWYLLLNLLIFLLLLSYSTCYAFLPTAWYLSLIVRQVKLLITAGADPNRRCRRGMTALEHAVAVLLEVPKRALLISKVPCL